MLLDTAVYIAPLNRDVKQEKGWWSAEVSKQQQMSTNLNSVQHLSAKVITIQHE
jgi:hypothetical protein